MAIQCDPDRFRDGGPVDSQPDWSLPGKTQIDLERTTDWRIRKFLWLSRSQLREQFKLTRRIAYRARAFDDAGDLKLILPANAATFRTDLTSVPALFTWLIPRTGMHLPAALIHDGLVFDPGEEQSYLSEGNRAVSRMQADTILRDAMADLGVSIPRRWLIWSAVTLATIRAGAYQRALPSSHEDAQPEVSQPRRALNNYYRIVAFGSLAVIAVLGIVATLDLFDKWNVLFWMNERSTPLEILYGAAGAVVVPAVLSVFWWAFWKAGLITGIALALLLHATLLLGALTAVFQAIDLVLVPSELDGPR